MDKPELKVGTIIIDNGKMGIITSVVENGKWEEYGPFSLTKSYEIRYFDGNLTMMTEKTIDKLIERGALEVVAQ
jgi:hypothetical protein